MGVFVSVEIRRPVEEEAMAAVLGHAQAAIVAGALAVDTEQVAPWRRHPVEWIASLQL